MELAMTRVAAAALAPAADEQQRRDDPDKRWGSHHDQTIRRELGAQRQGPAVASSGIIYYPLLFLRDSL
jgi:hypothetical protein